MKRGRTMVHDAEGRPMEVIRPKNPSLAVELATRAAEANDEALFQRLPHIVEDAAGEYTFMGYLAKRASGVPCIVNKKGAFLGELQPGDSFVVGYTERGSSAPESKV